MCNLVLKCISDFDSMSLSNEVCFTYISFSVNPNDIFSPKCFCRFKINIATVDSVKKSPKLTI